MIKGIYEAGAGMMARLAAQDITANNLANANTAGFQREVAGMRARLMPPGTTGAGSGKLPAQLIQPYSTPDMRPGILEHTGAATDLALDGPGYLMTQTAAGPRLVRGGAMHVNAGGELATAGGDAVLGTDGNPIRVGGTAWTVKQDGAITAGGVTLGKLRVVLPTGAMQHEGGTVLSAAGVKDAPPNSVRVLQGSLQHSNVEPVREMVDMIAGVRAYEASQKSLTAQDGTLQQLFSILQR
jgi:flagellar basal-body rod protein FlgG